jgi:hypothetical protein
MASIAEDTVGPNEENTWQGELDTFLQGERAGPAECISLTESGNSRFTSSSRLLTGTSVRHAHNASDREDPTEPPQWPDQGESFITILFRTLGLQSCRSAFLHKNEAPKIALRKSRAAALLRGTIHLTPVSVTITVMALNSVGLYVGGNVSWLPSLQFLAKLQEILMQASIATVVFAYIRHELITHDMPFGALFSAFQITTLNYLWSLEFWGSLTSPHLRGRRKIVFLAFVPLSILLAASVGPSLAIALIPRHVDFPAGRTWLWLNITQNGMFPAYLTVNDVPPDCASSSTLSLVGNDCPSSEWPTLAAMVSPLNYGCTWTGLQTPVAERELWLDVSSEQTVNSVYVTTPQAAVAEAFQNVGYLWDAAVADYPYTGDNPSRFRSSDNVIHTVDAFQPYVITRCLQNKVGSDPLEFPTRQSSWSSQEGHWTTANHSVPPSLSAMNSSYRIRWLELPPAHFPNASIGAIIQPPRILDALADPRPVACSIYAGWAPTRINLTQSSEYIQSWVPPGTNAFRWPIDWVSITSEWAASLTPPLSDQNTTVDAAFYSILNENLDTNQENSSQPAYIHEAVLASLVANGMARNGFDSGILDNPESDLPSSLPDETNRQWLSGSNNNIFAIEPTDPGAVYPLSITSVVSGLAYTTEGIPIKLAFAVLPLYCIYALSHLLYAAISGISSSSWESIAEITTLALASTIPDKMRNKLRNTIAGIATAALFREPVRISAFPDGHLELVFDSNGRKNKRVGRIEVNRVY